MEIQLENISKKFNRQWIFKNVNLTFSSGNIYAITGPNGSGKSTLLSIISGFAMPSGGKVIFRSNNLIIDEEEQYKQVSVAAPYLELIEEFTLEEQINFHFKFVQIIDNENVNSLIQFIKFENSRHKAIKFFSSGMKQRLKLGLALFTQKPAILLDEPTVNLDAEGCKWYHESIKEKLNNRLLIISSNVPEEYAFTENIISIHRFNT